jgi:hypothetical protein
MPPVFERFREKAAQLRKAGQSEHGDRKRLPWRISEPDHRFRLDDPWRVCAFQFFAMSRSFSTVGFFYTLWRILPWDSNKKFMFFFDKQWVDANRR